MANRPIVSPKFLKPLRNFIKRPLNSAAPTSFSAVSPANLPESFSVEPPTPAPAPATPPRILSLHDVEQLFASVSTEKLLRSAVNLRLASIGPMVDVGIRVMNSQIMQAPVLNDVMLAAIKHTFFEHFCAGQSAAEAAATAAKLSEQGLKGMLVYGLEHATNNESCDRNLEGFLQTVESAESVKTSSVSFIIAKISAICPLKLLERASDLLRWEYNHPSFKLPWKHESLPILTDSSPFYHTTTKPDPLTTEEEIELTLGHERLLKLCQKCSEANVPLCIDAEDTSVQPVIDYFTYSAALEYNKDENPIIYGTIQTYLRDARERMYQAQFGAEKMGVPMGFKLVRGAYLFSERKLAASLGVESPIHGTIDQTHACFNGCASFMLEKVANGKGAVVLATHNIDSGNKAAAQARELGIGEENQNLQFAQLYGMADALSFGLRNAGFQVSKYMPFGPVDKVMPYLLRRAEENRGLLSTSTLDRELLRMELVRRLKAVLHI